MSCFKLPYHRRCSIRHILRYTSQGALHWRPSRPAVFQMLSLLTYSGNHASPCVLTPRSCTALPEASVSVVPETLSPPDAGRGLLPVSDEPPDLPELSEFCEPSDEPPVCPFCVSSFIILSDCHHSDGYPAPALPDCPLTVRHLLP